jgi:hypothetical protein
VAKIFLPDHSTVALPIPTQGRRRMNFVYHFTDNYSLHR